MKKKGGNHFSWVSETNKITKVYLEEMNDIKELDFLLGLCRYVNHLQINSLHNINIESFIREILIRINDDSNEDLCLLCLRIPTADDQLIEKLKKMIDSKAKDLLIIQSNVSTIKYIYNGDNSNKLFNK